LRAGRGVLQQLQVHGACEVAGAEKERGARIIRRVGEDCFDPDRATILGLVKPRIEGRPVPADGGVDGRSHDSDFVAKPVQWLASQVPSGRPGMQEAELPDEIQHALRGFWTLCKLAVERLGALLKTVIEEGPHGWAPPDPDDGAGIVTIKNRTLYRRLAAHPRSEPKGFAAAPRSAFRWLLGEDLGPRIVGPSQAHFHNGQVTAIWTKRLSLKLAIVGRAVNS
jgi:hypothetical protein